MSKDPAFLFYSSDFLTGCSDLTMEERGQYITMLCLQHQKGHLNEKTIRLSLGSISVDVRNKFLTDNDNNLYNEILENHIKERENFVESRRINGSKGGRPKINNKPSAKPSAYPKNNLREDESEDEDIIINKDEKENLKNEFNEFWKLYPKKRAGSQDKAYKSFCKVINNKLITADRLINVVKLYSKSDEVKRGFAKGCAAWLNDERFNDEYSVEKYDKKSTDDWWRK